MPERRRQQVRASSYSRNAKCRQSYKLAQFGLDGKGVSRRFHLEEAPLLLSPPGRAFQSLLPLRRVRRI